MFSPASILFDFLSLIAFVIPAKIKNFSERKIFKIIKENFLLQIVILPLHSTPPVPFRQGTNNQESGFEKNENYSGILKSISNKNGQRIFNTTDKRKEIVFVCGIGYRY
jgi:hypothetical protein